MMGVVDMMGSVQISMMGGGVQCRYDGWWCAVKNKRSGKACTNLLHKQQTLTLTG
jgi:hypothetical protein